jgi:deferrochelatase/peroxidase EfeB
VQRPPALVDLPSFTGDQVDPAASHGDVFVQLCSNDAVYLGGAVRALRAAAAPALVPRWQLNGFRGVAAASSPSNGRNLMGQIDGTNNIAVSRGSTGGPVWVDAATPVWMAGGSYVAVRRFRMLLIQWESASPDDRDRSVGRHIATGAPLGSTAEADPVDLEATTAGGAPLIPADAHVRLAAPRRGAGEEMLRRSYSYTNGQAAAGGEEDAGLIFVSYQSDPRTSFIPVQQRLADSDALARFTVATSSALFAVLPGVTDAGDWYGRALLG